jgi:hypothetical protein
MPKATIKDLPKDSKISLKKIRRMRGVAETTDPIYQTRTDESGQTSAQFGDGEGGARLPNGDAAISAGYRKQRNTAGTNKGRRSARDARAAIKIRHE